MLGKTYLGEREDSPFVASAGKPVCSLFSSLISPRERRREKGIVMFINPLLLPEGRKREALATLLLW